MTKITYTPEFKKEFKRLSKKFKSLDEEIRNLISLLSKNPETGTDLGNSIYKIRLGVKSKGKGKSGGMRVITYFYSADEELYLLHLYDKS